MDIPQLVIFALHVAATCGFALEYAAMIRHFLILQVQSNRFVDRVSKKQNKPFIANSWVDKLRRRIRPDVLYPLNVIEFLRLLLVSDVHRIANISPH